MNTYAETVTRNLRHMNTDASEWSACACEMKQDQTGATFPDSALPSGYSQAPSMIPDSAGAGACPCLLCGHAIKNVYWIQNDARKWILRVGSECVTHFAEKTGQQIAKDAELERARKALETLRAIRDYQRTKYTYSVARACESLLGTGELKADGAIRTWWRYRKQAFGTWAQRLIDERGDWQRPERERVAQILAAI